ncbi:chaperone protein dnaJ 20, chloroplastic-like [Curcuma longa]|uniref:chaperone protein dnaJ 20, chloroplastic-like n=1 Tax=Curcuma longa TaxID=136217 RepID=UPI003D9F7107
MNTAVLSRNLTFPGPSPVPASGAAAVRIRSRVLLRRAAGPRPSLRSPTCRAGPNLVEGFVRETARTFYDLLGVPASGSAGEIKKAYKRLARKYHPDVSPADRAEEYTRRFIEVHEAYETLSDPGLREIYDRQLTRGLTLAFSARRRFEEDLEEKSGWRGHWQDQLTKLRTSSMNDSEGNLSWGAWMRRRSAVSS